MGEINWIHISDLHHKFKNFETKVIRKSLISKVTELKNKINRYDFLVVTGDIADKGAIDKDTISYVKEIMTAAGVEADNIYIVPGNHDIKKGEGSSRNGLLNDFLYKQSNPSGYITGAADLFKENLLKDQKGFYDFYKELCHRDSISDAEKKLHFVEERDNCNILNINTSWLCRESKEDIGRLVIGKNLLYEAAEKLNRNKPTIALGHHTIDSLDNNERKDILRIFYDFNVDLYLCGHIHEADFERGTEHRNVNIVTSSATISDGYATPGFTTGTINISTGEGKIRYYRYYTKNQQALGFWDLDHSIDEEVAEKGYKPITIQRLKAASKHNNIGEPANYVNNDIAVTQNITNSESVNKLIINKYIPKFINNKNLNNETDFSVYSRLFSLIAEYGNSNSDDIFSFMEKKIINSSVVVPLQIKGSPGTGKTTLLCVLYHYMKQKHIQDSNNPLPIYIDVGSILHNNIEGDINNSSILEAFKKDTEPLVEFIARYSGSVLLIIDGIDEFLSVKKSIHQYLFNRLYNGTNGLPKVKKIIGISSDKATLEEFNYGRSRAQTTIELHPLESNNTKLDLLIELYDKTYAQYNSKSAKPDKAIIAEKIRQWKINNIDLFTLNLLYTSLQVLRDVNSCDTLVNAYKQYCNDYLIRAGADVIDLEKILNNLSKLAYKCVANSNNKDLDIKDLAGVFGWKVIYKHSTIRDYLAARFIANSIENFTAKDETNSIIFEYIYPHQINKFLKGIINENSETQQIILNAIRKLANGNNTPLRSMAVYIAGRLISKDYKEQAKQFLDQLKKTIIINLDSLKNMEELFYYRSIYISLICLGDRAALEEYINYLLKYPEWNELNRGFHLEYYGDISYALKNKSAHKDSLEAFKNTYYKLSQSILNNVMNDKYLLWNLELFTLCSLVQSREYRMEKCGFDKKEFSELLNKAAERISMPGILKYYVQMIKRDLKKDKFDIGYLISELYGLKHLRRRGWPKRNLVNTESVADHLFGTYSLGMVYLPEETEDKKYNKNLILQMLLVHDLAEAYIGDLAPDEKTEEMRLKEKHAFQRLSLANTYEGIYCLDKGYELWLEYEEDKTCNAKIAKEIDRLDSLVQLYYYKERGRYIHDFEKWQKDIEKSINTDCGQKILKIIKQHFNNLNNKDLEDEKNVLIHPIYNRTGKRQAGDILKISNNEVQGLCIDKIKYIAVVDWNSRKMQYIAKVEFLTNEKGYRYQFKCNEFIEVNQITLSPLSNYFGTLFSLNDIKTESPELR